MFNVGGLLKSVQILTTCESFQRKSRWQHQSATSICPRLPCIPVWLFIRFLRHGRAKVILDSFLGTERPFTQSTFGRHN